MATKTINNQAAEVRIQSNLIYGAWALAVLALALVLRLMGLNKGIWLDEFATLQIILQGSLSKATQAMRADNHPPLYFLLLWAWSQVSAQEAFLRLPAVVFGFATVPVVMAWGKFYSRLGGLLAGLLCATIPVMLFYSQEIRHYSLLVFTTALSFFFAAAILKKPDQPHGYMGLAVSLTLAMATHLLGLLVLGAVVVYLALTPKDIRQVDPFKLGISFLVPLVAFVFFYFFFLRDLNTNLQDWWVPPVSWKLIISTSRDLLGVDKALEPARELRTQYPLISAGLSTLVKLCALGFAALILTLGEWKRSYPLAAAGAVYLLGLTAYSMLFKPLLLSRTALPALVPLIVFAGVQAASIRSGSLRLAAVLLLAGLALIFVIDWSAFQAGNSKEGWAKLSAVLKAEMGPADLAVFYPSYVQGPVGYYFPELPQERSLTVNIGESQDRFETQIEAWAKENLAAGSSPLALFLVVRKDSLVDKDERHYQEMKAFLEARFGKPAALQEFGDLSISRYDIVLPGQSTCPLHDCVLEVAFSNREQ